MWWTVVKSVINILQVEYMLVEMDDKNEKVCLVLNGKDVLEILQEKGEKINPKWVTVLVGFIARHKKIKWFKIRSIQKNLHILVAYSEFSYSSNCV